MELEKNTNKVEKVMKEFESIETSHDYFDVLNHGVEEVLTWYGIKEKLNEAESKILKEFLLEKVHQTERKAVSRIAGYEKSPSTIVVPNLKESILENFELEFADWKKINRRKKHHHKDDDLFDLARKHIEINI